MLAAATVAGVQLATFAWLNLFFTPAPLPLAWLATALAVVAVYAHYAEPRQHPFKLVLVLTFSTSAMALLLASAARMPVGAALAGTVVTAGLMNPTLFIAFHMDFKRAAVDA